MRNLQIRTFSALIALLIALCGCSNAAPTAAPADAPPSQSENTDAAQTTQAAGVTAALRFLDATSDDAAGKYYQELFSEFTAETGIAVTYETIPGEFARDKLILLNSVAQMPDIVITRADWLKELVYSDCLISLDKYTSIDRRDFCDVVNKVIWKREKEQLSGIYSIPCALRVQCVYYHKNWAERIIKSDQHIEQEALLSKDPEVQKRKEELDKLPKFTLSDQWTYDDLLALITRSTNRVSRRYGLALVGGEGEFWQQFNGFMQNYSGGYTFDVSNACVFGSEAMTRAMMLYGDLVYSGKISSEAYNWGKREALSSFLSDEAAVYIGDSTDLTYIMSQMESSALGVLPMPVNAATGKRLNAVSAPYSYSITSDCQRPEDAWKLISYLTSPAKNVPFCKENDTLPVRKTLDFDLDYSDGGKYYPFMYQLNDAQLLVPQTVPELDAFEQVRGELWKYINGISDEAMASSNITQLLTHSLNTYLSANPLYKLDTPVPLS